jgi:hypothetical protein
MRRNYYRKLWGEIITENYQLVYQSRGKCEIYGDFGVSKKNEREKSFNVSHFSNQ